MPPAITITLAVLGCALHPAAASDSLPLLSLQILRVSLAFNIALTVLKVVIAMQTGKVRMPQKRNI